ncbi:MAG: squalene/phytoene synthase family protein, partial [Betaproteobacteria bacterium]|nr:squalene/phytoene synthase family protein [Betaproteobacteria bacterium]
MNPFDYCTDKVAKRGTALFYATFQLPEAKRQAVAAIHAFRQEVQEAVVDISDPTLGTVKLQWWRNQIAAVFDGTPQHPVASALQALVRTYTLPAPHFLALIDGIEGDLAMPRYPDLDTLVRYCDLTGAVPNALTAEILGYRDTRTIDCVRDLGTACALACVVRDVGRAARRDRIYLPADE